MHIHELQDLDYEDALNLLETELENLKLRIGETEEKLNGAGERTRRDHEAELAELHARRREAEEALARLREMKSEEYAGEKDNLLTETLRLFDQIGERIDRLVDALGG